MIKNHADSVKTRMNNFLVGSKACLFGTLLWLSVSFPSVVAAADSCSIDPGLREFVRQTYNDRITFDVVRKGKVVGRHTNEFSDTGQGLAVRSNMQLTVTVLFIPVFDFTYDSRAVWCDQGLVQLSSRVDRNGDATTVDARFDGNQTIITGGGGNVMHSGQLIPTNHWNPSVLQRDAVLNTITGQVNRVDIVPCAAQTAASLDLSLPAEAECYQYTGDLAATVWYLDRRWIGLAFKGDDGSDIVYRCRECGK